AEIYRKLSQLGRRYESLIRERFPQIPRRVSGYNLPAILPGAKFNLARALSGSEGTCAMLLEATVELIDHLSQRVLVVLGYPDVYAAADHIPTIRKFKPVGCEGVDDRLVEDMRLKGLHERDISLLPKGGGWLLVEFGANRKQEALEKAQ